jgi:hypothetical protein
MAQECPSFDLPFPNSRNVVFNVFMAMDEEPMLSTEACALSPRIEAAIFKP